MILQNFNTRHKYSLVRMILLNQSSLLLVLESISFAISKLYWFFIFDNFKTTIRSFNRPLFDKKYGYKDKQIWVYNLAYTNVTYI